MRRQRLMGVGVLALGLAVGWGAWAFAQQPPSVAVPAVPNIGTVTPSQPPSELSVAHKGMVYIGYRGAYHVGGAGQEGRAMYRDANNQFFDNNLTYYGTNNGYWIAQVNGLPDTFLAFQATPTSSEAPFFRVLIHTPSIQGYAAWDEATRGNAQ